MNIATTEVKRGRKYDQVIDGARTVFMADGFEGASVDTIAKAAGVSKATLYSYFPDKKLLFTEVARGECQRQAALAAAKIDIDSSIRTVLTGAATHMLGFFLSEFGRSVFRICVAESERFPELGRQFYESGPMLVRTTLAGFFEEAMARNELDIPDCGLAADQFAELCKASLFPRTIFGVQTEFTDAEIAQVIEGAVDMFLARYAVSTPA